MAIKGLAEFRFIHIILALCAVSVSLNLTGVTFAQAPAPTKEYQPAVPDSAPITDREYEQFATSLEQDIYAEPKVDFEKFCNMDWLTQRVAGDMDQKDTKIKDLMAGWKQGYIQSNPLSLMQQLVRDGGSYDFLKVLDNANGKQSKRVIFRMVRPDGGYNYHEFLLAKSPDGKVRAYDIFTHLNAEFQSETSRRLLLYYIQQNEAKLLTEISGTEKAELENVTKLQQMAEFNQLKQYEKALLVYYQMPEQTQQLKHVLTMRFTAAFGKMDHQEIVKTYDDFQKKYPADNCLNFLGVTYFSSKGDYDKTIKCLDAISQAIKGDPFLDIKKAEMYEAKDEYATAEKMTLAALQQDSSLIDGYWLMITISLNQEDHAKTLEWLKKIDSQFEMDWNDISSVEDYSEFIKSPQYKEWTKHLANKPKKK